MANGNRTGPSGMGSRTGRQLGFCSGYDTPGNLNQTNKEPLGRNRQNFNQNLLRGLGQRIGRGLGQRIGRGLGRGFGRLVQNQFSKTTAETTNETKTNNIQVKEKNSLQEELIQLDKETKDIENEKEIIKKRLEQLND